MKLTIRDFVYEISPPWMRDENNAKINFALATISDSLADKVEQGVRAAFPGVGTPTALPYIGNDRDIERGPTQTDAGYAAQLRGAFDTWQNAGGARTLLAQLRLYFTPGNGPPMRLVAQHPSGVGGHAIWHVINPSTGVVTKSYHDNWLWNSDTVVSEYRPDEPYVPWHRGWIIIEGAGLWTADYWDQIGTWGDGGVWGSSMSYEETRVLVSIIRKWKPANVLAQPIITFNAGTFAVSNNRPPNPNNNGDDEAWRATQPVIFLDAITT